MPCLVAGRYADMTTVAGRYDVTTAAGRYDVTTVAGRYVAISLPSDPFPAGLIQASLLCPFHSS